MKLDLKSALTDKPLTDSSLQALINCAVLPFADDSGDFFATFLPLWPIRTGRRGKYPLEKWQSSEASGVALPAPGSAR